MGLKFLSTVTTKARVVLFRVFFALLIWGLRVGGGVEGWGAPRGHATFVGRENRHTRGGQGGGKAGVRATNSTLCGAAVELCVLTLTKEEEERTLPDRLSIICVCVLHVACTFVFARLFLHSFLLSCCLS